MPYADPANYELPFQSSSDTSRDAARKAKDRVGPQGIEVLAWFFTRGGLGGTQKEACRALPHIERPAMCARVHALEKCGNLRKSAERREGCTVYVIAR